MLIIKGLLILAPFYLYNLWSLRISNAKNIVITAVLGLMTFVIIFSTYSFIGWTIDWLVFSLTLILILRRADKNWTNNKKMLVKILATIIVGVCLLSSYLFGRKLENKYELNGLNFAIYRIPDMVLFDTYDLEIKETFGLFERELFSGKIRNPKCTYDYNEFLMKPTAINNCE